MTVSYVIERKNSGSKNRHFWTGARKKWSSNIDDAITVHSERRASEIIEAANKTDSAGREYVYTIKELT